MSKADPPPFSPTVDRVFSEFLEALGDNNILAATTVEEIRKVLWQQKLDDLSP